MVHPTSVHESLLANAKQWQSEHDGMRYLVIATSPRESDDTNTVSYAGMWFKNAIREQTLLRMVML